MKIVSALALGMTMLACNSTEGPAPLPGKPLVSPTTDLPGAEARPVRIFRASVRGTLSTPITAQLRVAILWEVTGGGGDAFWRRAEDIGIANSWPVHFTLDLAMKPPADAIQPFVLGVPGDATAPVLQEARAKVVVYEDRNGNEKLDLIPEGSDERIDLLRGADDDLFLEWLDATDADWERNEYTGPLGLTRGMNIVRRPQTLRAGPECVATPCDPESSGPHALPFDEEVVLSSTVSPLSESLACAKFVGLDSTAGDINTPCASPLPPGRGVLCLAWDRSAYLSIDFGTKLPVCNWRNKVHYCGVHRDPREPAPAEWPCP